MDARKLTSSLEIIAMYSQYVQQEARSSAPEGEPQRLQLLALVTFAVS